MALFPSESELKKERQVALRNFRALLRHLDTQLEVVQRIGDRLAGVKTRLEHEQAVALADPWTELQHRVALCEKGLSDFLGIFY